ncbi:MAG: VWA domain-containing protein [Candidatus Binatia bacterium]|nr:VWA domain-containing protein [Candidatus Binatia bacterium]
MQLEYPWVLLLLAFLPLLLWWWNRPTTNEAAPLPFFPHLPSAPLGRVRWQWLPNALRTLCLAALVVAASRPQYGTAESEYRGEGIDIVLAVDISGSMLAEDFTKPSGERANRLEVVKDVVREFVARRRNDRIGLVVFAGRPYTQCPLTLDHGWLLRNLERVQIGMIEDGTAIGSALATAAGRLEASDAKSKVIVLLTDGQNNAGKVSPKTAAEAAATLGIRVYTIGAGTRGLAPFPARDVFGNRVYRPMPVDVDEATLQEVAELTGGRYFRATDTASLRQVYNEIDRMERTEFTAPRYHAYEDAYPWFILAGLLLYVSELVLRHTWLRVVP